MVGKLGCDDVDVGEFFFLLEVLDFGDVVFFLGIFVGDDSKNWGRGFMVCGCIVC